MERERGEKRRARQRNDRQKEILKGVEDVKHAKKRRWVEEKEIARDINAGREKREEIRSK